ncbi:MAG: HlyD family efflux transporter periplasmic adaptor subunit [Leptolyngbyaceae cyanobacterium]
MARSLSPPQDTDQPSFEAPVAVPHKRPPVRLLLPLVLLVVGTGTGIWYLLSRPSSTAIQLSGRIEGYPTDIGAKVGGRVNQVTVREGDQVRQGEVIVRLDDAELQAQLQGATARLYAAQQQAQQAAMQIQVVNNRIAEGQLAWQQSVGDAQGRIYQAEANVAAAQAQLGQAEAQLHQARAELKLAAVNRDRFAELTGQGAATQQQLDQAQTTYETAQATLRSREAAVAAAQRQVNAAQGGSVQARTSGLNPGIRNAQLAILKQQLEVARSQLAAAQAEVKNAQAARQQVLAQLGYLNVTSPLTGVVLTRSVEPGQVVTTGKTLMTVIDPNVIYLRGYVPEGDIGRVKVGQPAKVFLDANPKQGLDAKVTAIDTQASFTPENIYFREDRVRQVFGVRLTLTEPTGLAKPGMPADGEILVNQNYY